MSTKIYTKTGDGGNTSLLGGTKVSKSHVQIESYGTVDELNAHIGLIADLLADKHSKMIIREIQDRLFTIGSLLARDTTKKTGIILPVLKEEDIRLLEKEIDRMSALLPPLKTFILPGGHVTVSSIHIARCVCRRAERACVSMKAAMLPVDDLVLQYLNRLSDYLFMSARYASHLLKVEEIFWKPRT